jgi:diacylglycerol kinase family enzyme
MKATLIVNPFASRVTEERLRALESVLSEAAELTTVLTERAGHAVELARAVDGEVLYVYGGDGVFNEALNGLERDVSVGLVPGGHTNVLPRALGLPRDAMAAARQLTQARTRRISLGRVNGRRFGFAAGIGVDADAVRRVDELGRAEDGRRPGDFTYARVVAGLLLHGYEPSLELRGLGRASVALVSNDAVFTFAGPRRITFSPQSRFELGLDVVAPLHLRGRSLPRILGRVASGRGLAGATGVLSGHDLDRIEVSCDLPLPLEADGEDLGDVTEAVFEAERNAVTMLV